MCVFILYFLPCKYDVIPLLGCKSYINKLSIYLSKSIAITRSCSIAIANKWLFVHFVLCPKQGIKLRVLS